MKRSWIPNALTLARLVLVGPILWCLAEGWFPAAVALFAVAGLTDALDGYLARRLDARSALGAALDPMADKALLSGAYVALAWLGALPVWLAGLVVGRDLAILIAAGLVRLRWGAFSPRPSMLSKVNTAAQLVLAAVAMIHQALVPESEPVMLAALIGLVAVTTVASGLGYAWTAWHRLRERPTGPHTGSPA
ncbi:CDP-alcohol phosphatidyltransferase family protein [Roseospira navarrensis]|uniref:CDP-alcohol phosphatidyltransferase family protein n=1 Tax=Roseospira navarrensis TaxID=140058 RepID=UPI0014789DDE